MTDPTQPAATESRLALTDFARGIAALLVAAFHATALLSKPKYFAVDPTQGFFQFGSRGVDFFFVLSGFIIAYVHWFDLGKPNRLRAYSLKRAIRIYLPLWVVAVPYILACFLMNADILPPGWSPRLEQVFGSLTLMPTRELPLPTVVWTLKHEMLFYILFAVILWRPRIGAALFALGGLLCLYHATIGFASNFLVDFFCSVYNLEFILGVGCGIYARNAKVPYPVAFAMLGLVLFAYAAVDYREPEFVARWLANTSTLWQATKFGVSSALIILGLSQIDRSTSVKVPPALALLGSASYAIYLVHAPAMTFSCKALMVAGRYVPLSPWLAFGILMAIGVSTGIAFHFFIEMPLVRCARRWAFVRRVQPPNKQTEAPQLATAEASPSPPGA